MTEEQIYTPADFVAVFNQTLEYAYPSVLLQGELADYRVSKGRWLYLKLKDEHASIQCFGTVQQLQHPLEEGMLVQLRGYPRLHPLYNFSIQIQFIQPVGQGSIKKAADILREKLKKEGLFDDSRKRRLPYPPKTIGLITSKESAAYQDFIKILSKRWGGLAIELASVQVQGEPAPEQITTAIKQFNNLSSPPEVLVLTRGGGSPEDLAAFQTEIVTRAVADSRIPTLVAVGHETDVSLAELAADMRASTPSNAAELLVPDKRDAMQQLAELAKRTDMYLASLVASHRQSLENLQTQTIRELTDIIKDSREWLAYRQNLLTALHPSSALRRGYSIVRTKKGDVVRSGTELESGAEITIELTDAKVESLVQSIHSKKRKDT